MKLDDSGHEVWRRTFAKGCLYDIKTTADGGLVAAGESAGGFYLVKTDANGDLEWSRTYAEVALGNVNAVQEVSNGGFVLVGSILGYGPGHTKTGYMIRTDSEGREQWDHMFFYWCSTERIITDAS